VFKISDFILKEIYKLAECEESVVDAMHEAVLLEVESTWKSRHKE
jgi:hypothetical protein